MKLGHLQIWLTANALASIAALSQRYLVDGQPNPNGRKLVLNEIF
jgi:hypothetical protein